MNEFESLIMNSDSYSGFFSCKDFLVNTRVHLSKKHQIEVNIEPIGKKNPLSITERKLLDFHKKNIHMIWPEWTIELLRECDDKFNLSNFGFKIEKEITMDDTERCLRLIFVDN